MSIILLHCQLLTFPSCVLAYTTRSCWVEEQVCYTPTFFNRRFSKHWGWWHWHYPQRGNALGENNFLSYIIINYLLHSPLACASCYMTTFITWRFLVRKVMSSEWTPTHSIYNIEEQLENLLGKCEWMTACLISLSARRMIMFFISGMWTSKCI